MSHFNKILIANRGEIAVRIMKTARRMGIQTVAVYSEPDSQALHRNTADESIRIGGADLSDSYLNIPAIIAAAEESGAEAIHPGYGFLAENPAFVAACEEAGITFIGPASDVMKLMGNKIEARAFVKSINVPVTEGHTGSPEELSKLKDTLNYPILIKAAAGGGGKGMRIVRNASEFDHALETTAREAKNYFGDGTVYIEKYLDDPRHIEVQILGDSHGGCIHLFERECSVQRRYQKIIEESPSVTLNDELRREMGESAVAIGKQTKYRNAGTIEFLVDNNLNYYFLEMNTRIQVEHPVTELVTGIDIVEEQIRIAAGEKLRFQQQDIKQTGNAVECRIYAENPENNFMPSPGTITLYKEPRLEMVRIDSSLNSEAVIESFFDPMIAKVITHAGSRNEAAAQMMEALQHYIIQGIHTNIPYLKKVLQHQAYRKNEISTKFCDEHTEEFNELLQAEKAAIPKTLVAAAYYFAQSFLLSDDNADSVWRQTGYWRNYLHKKITIDDEEVTLSDFSSTPPGVSFSVNDDRVQVSLLRYENNLIKFSCCNRQIEAYVSRGRDGNVYITIAGREFTVSDPLLLNHGEDLPAFAAAALRSSDDIVSPMPGKVIKVNAKEGQTVKKGDILLIVEAMKMENSVAAIRDGIVEKVSVKQGEKVDTATVLVHLKKEEEE